jgi:hypothetical protein
MLPTAFLLATSSKPIEKITNRVPSVCTKADVAQLVEQPIRNRQVSGSSPLVGSRFYAGQSINDWKPAFFIPFPYPIFA